MLKLRLRDHETVIINGAVMRSSGRCELVLENRAAILRGREVMKPEEAITPAQKLYFTTMLHYIDHDGRGRHQPALLSLLATQVAISSEGGGQELCAQFARRLAEGDHYGALAVCRDMIADEKHLAGQRIPAASQMTSAEALA